VNGADLVAFRPHAPTRFALLVTLAIAAASCLTPGRAAAGPLQDDLKARRARVLERLGPEALASFWSAPTRVYSGDVDYEYRQESNFLYLTGNDQPESVLVLMPGNATRREISLSVGPTPGASTGRATASRPMRPQRRAGFRR
jgi:hypothetical protein